MKPSQIKPPVPCSICGAFTKSKLNIEARKGTYYPVCGGCFIKTEFMLLKDVRKLIKPKHI